jgi:hypothetical protein
MPSAPHIEGICADGCAPLFGYSIKVEVVHWQSLQIFSLGSLPRIPGVVHDAVNVVRQAAEPGS